MNPEPAIPGQEKYSMFRGNLTPNEKDRAALQKTLEEAGEPKPSVPAGEMTPLDVEPDFPGLNSAPDEPLDTGIDPIIQEEVDSLDTGEIIIEEDDSSDLGPIRRAMEKDRPNHPVTARDIMGTEQVYAALSSENDTPSMSGGADTPLRPDPPIPGERKFADMANADMAKAKAGLGLDPSYHQVKLGDVEKALEPSVQRAQKELDAGFQSIK